MVGKPIPSRIVTVTTVDREKKSGYVKYGHEIQAIKCGKKAGYVDEEVCDVVVATTHYSVFAITESEEQPAPADGPPAVPVLSTWLLMLVLIMSMMCCCCGVFVIARVACKKKKVSNTKEASVYPDTVCPETPNEKTDAGASGMGMKVTNSEITSFSDSEEDGDLGVEENSKEYRNKKAEGDLGGLEKKSIFI